MATKQTTAAESTPPSPSQAAPTASAKKPPASSGSKTGGSAPSAQSLLIEWANQQDNWTRALVSEVITTRQELPDTRVQHFYELLLIEKELLPGTATVVPPLSGGLTGAAAGESVALMGLEATQGVNALAAGQKIDFNPRMTIIFGENASGKTGYVRVLKRAAAVRTAEVVLPNVNAPASTGNTPKAKIGYLLGSHGKTADWANEAGVHPFTRMDVFDSSCTLLHLDEDLTYIYTPGELSLFPLVQHSIEKVKTKLESDSRARSTASNPFVREFERGTRVYTKIEALGAATNIESCESSPRYLKKSSNKGLRFRRKSRRFGRKLPRHRQRSPRQNSSFCRRALGLCNPLPHSTVPNTSAHALN